MTPPVGAAPRIAPGGRADVGPVAWALCRLAGRVARTEPPKLFLTLARRPGLFFGWLMFAGRLMPRGKLPRRETELVILRVAHLTGCDYEASHHRRIARRSGVTPVGIERVIEGPGASGWSDRERAVLAAVDELHDSRDLSDESFAAVRRHLDEAEVVELLMLVGHYEMLAMFLNTLRVQPDVPRA